MNQEIIKELTKIGESLENVGKSLKKIAQYLNINNQSFDNNIKVLENQTSKDIEDSQIRNEIIDYLEKYKFIVRLIPKNDISPHFINIAKYIGDKYDYIKEFLKQMKRSLSTGNSIQMYMKNFGEEKITYTCQLASNLHKLAFLENYKYHNSPKFLLTAQPIREPLVINFINGDWLEHYLIYKIEFILSSFGLEKAKDFDYLKNIELKFPNGSKSETDAFFKIKDKIFLFEGKTGDEYQRYVHDYSEKLKLLNIPKYQAFMVITDISKSDAEALFNSFNITVCNLSMFDDLFIDSLKKLNIVG